jgi:hypothetical protein
MGLINRASTSGARESSLRNAVLKYKHDGVLGKNRTMDNVQKPNICTNVPSSQTFFFFTGSTAPLGLGLCFYSSMIILQTVGLLGRGISSSQGLYLNIGQHKHRINTYTHQTFMPCVGFGPTIPASERVKTVHALDRSATVTGTNF